MLVERGYVTGHTRMSLDERFTQLRRGGMQRRNLLHQDDFHNVASIRNRRLAMQMSRRPAVIAALSRAGNFVRENNLRGRSMMGRNNNPFLETGIASRLQTQGFIQRRQRLPRRGNNQLIKSQSLQSLNVQSNQNGRDFRPRGGRQPLNQIRNLKRLTRSQSLQSLNLNPNFFRGINNRRGRFLTARGRGALNMRRNNNRRGRIFKNNNSPTLNQLSVRGRGNLKRRGARRGGGGGGRGRGQHNTQPSREVLDKELDQYMSSCKSALDKELDSYMNQTEEKWD
ncbi:chromatin target of PRMT1 protein-like [Cimex lectularius]|uniref:Chromatin target of PRMT1 protein C-terminal domain-containing protein n=1 Tax=Cimex lectularius TaxID=79782 RepID=A0A8I6SM56_CIMLE|nr:chromatin target of PRMT1 protein-like [Cimex lectularius]XP_024085721.1 chromatin target of PRMT1 protein-like [Cimex lectularius]